MSITTSPQASSTRQVSAFIAQLKARPCHRSACGGRSPTLPISATRFEPICDACRPLIVDRYFGYGSPEYVIASPQIEVTTSGRFTISSNGIKKAALKKSEPIDTSNHPGFVPTKCPGCKNEVPRWMLDAGENRVCLECAISQDAFVQRYVSTTWRNDHRGLGSPMLSKEQGSVIPAGVIFGLELEVQVPDFMRLNAESLSSLGALPQPVNVGTDGSINARGGFNGYELRLPPVSGAVGEKLVLDTCAALNGARTTVDSSCGFHCHIDGSNMTGRQIASLLEAYILFEDTLLSLLPRTRRANRYAERIGYYFSGYQLRRLREQAHGELGTAGDKKVRSMLEGLWYKKPKREVAMLKMRRANRGHESRYFGLNLHSLFTQGHYELRYHPGTTHPDKILSWVALNAHFFLKAKEGRDLPYHSMNEALNGEERVRIMCEWSKVPAHITEFYLKRHRKFASISEEDAEPVGKLQVK